MILNSMTNGCLVAHVSWHKLLSAPSKFPQTTTASMAYDETVQCLLDAFPGGIRAMDNDGMAPLELACEMDASLSLIFQLVRVYPIMNLRPIGGAAEPARKRKRDKKSNFFPLLALWTFATISNSNVPDRRRITL